MCERLAIFERDCSSCYPIASLSDNLAHTKAKGAAKGNRDSIGKRLGVKLHDGQKAQVGNIIIRQRGSRFWAGEGVKLGSDDTMFAMKDGLVKFTTRKKKNYDGNSRIIKVVSVI